MDDTDTESQSLPSPDNYEQLRNVFIVTGIFSVTLIVWLLFGREHPILWMINLSIFNLISFFLKLFGLPWAIELNVVYFILVYIHFIASKSDVFGRNVFVLGWVLFTIGLMGIFVATVVCWTIKKYNQTCVDLSCVVLVNGYATLCYIGVKRGSYAWKVSSVVLLGVLGLLTLICCGVTLFGKFQEWRRRRVRVQSLPDSIEAV